MTDVTALIAANTKRWQNMTVNPNVVAEVDKVADRLMAPAAQARYAKVEAATLVPKNIIAVIHELEASQNWNTQLGQGDPLDRVSTHVPKGRGPFNTWEDGAIDALVNCPPYASKWKDWSVGGSLTLLEQYNGLGYYNKGVPSPYIWAGTNQYVKGKYVADGKYDPNAVSKQLGCAALLDEMGMRHVVAPSPVPTPAPSFRQQIKTFIKHWFGGAP